MTPHQASILGISCFIITKNEENNIARAIKSVSKICTEVLVIDSGSTDRTREIAESLGAKVFLKEWPGYLEQKIFGESICKNEWILNIDADEELSEKLGLEIEVLANTGMLSKYKAYEIDLNIMIKGDLLPRTFAPFNRCVRLYNISHAGFNRNKGDSTHDDVKLDSSVNRKKEVFTLISPAYHRSGASITQLIHKANFYSSEQSNAMFQKGRKVSKIRIFFEFPWWFLKAFFVRRYFVFGFIGFIYSSIFAFTKFVRLAKLYEKYEDGLVIESKTEE